MSSENGIIVNTPGNSFGYIRNHLLTTFKSELSESEREKYGAYLDSLKASSQKSRATSRMVAIIAIILILIISTRF